MVDIEEEVRYWKVKYEWVPIVCNHCKAYGHIVEFYKEKDDPIGKKQKKVWVEKKKAVGDIGACSKGGEEATSTRGGGEPPTLNGYDYELERPRDQQS
uniref:Uncharacterized protein n=1 Tax=Cannabis sativa TaxID=3483 RepID=A0A803PER2_CANSA